MNISLILLVAWLIYNLIWAAKVFDILVYCRATMASEYTSLVTVTNSF